jgi:hypothetical protein
MKKVKTLKGFVIALDPSKKVGEHEYYNVFTKEEWACGEGCRYPEYEGLGSVKECIDNINTH